MLLLITIDLYLLHMYVGIVYLAYKVKSDSPTLIKLQVSHL